MRSEGGAIHGDATGNDISISIDLADHGIGIGESTWIDPIEVRAGTSIPKSIDVENSVDGMGGISASRLTSIQSQDIVEWVRDS